VLSNIKIYKKLIVIIVDEYTVWKPLLFCSKLSKIDYVVPTCSDIQSKQTIERKQQELRTRERRTSIKVTTSCSAEIKHNINPVLTV